MTPAVPSELIAEAGGDSGFVFLVATVVRALRKPMVYKV
jgi:hypothetical protein